MKKIMSLIVAISMICLSGCTTFLKQPENNLYDDTAAVNSLLIQLESDINQSEENKENTSSVFENESQNTNAEQSDKPNDSVDEDAQNIEIQNVKQAEIKTDDNQPLYYTHLTDEQKQIYRYMKTAADKMIEGYFSIGASSSEDERFSDIAISYRALLCDCPEMFWLSSSYVVSTDGSAIAFSYADEDIDYIMTPEQKNAAQGEIESIIDKIVSYANTLSTNFEKELFFHDWLCKSIKYVDSKKESDHTVYGAFIERSAVCEGYSRAMQILCRRVNIPCMVVYGSSFGNSHMWNIINPGDGWYHLDVTWDDDEKYNYIRHAYFNVNDSEFFKDHEIFEQVDPDENYFSGDEFNIYNYKCELDNYNYFVKTKLIFTSDYLTNAKMIKQAAKSGRNNLEVYYSGDDYVEFLNEINVALANSGSKVWLNDYSYLGSSLVVCW